MKTLSWIFDYYILWILYNERKYHKYKDFMTKKWGTKFTNKI
jgi:hypothetical protein